MKRGNELVGLPIINISEGKQIGFVKGVVINPIHFSIDSLKIDQVERHYREKTLAYQYVIGIGTYAVMVEQGYSLIDSNYIPSVFKNVQPVGSKVITRSGEYVGTVLDYSFYEESGELESLFIKSDTKDRALQIDHVISFGDNRVIMTDSELSLTSQDFQQVTSEKSSTKKEVVKDMAAEMLKRELTKGNALNANAALLSKLSELLLEKNNKVMNGENSSVNSEKKSTKKEELKKLLFEMIKGNPTNTDVLGMLNGNTNLLNRLLKEFGE